VNVIIFQGFCVFGEAFDDIFEIFVGGSDLFLLLELGGFIGGGKFLELRCDG
jgi:hypothetical protein